MVVNGKVGDMSIQPDDVAAAPAVIIGRVDDDVNEMTRIQSQSQVAAGNDGDDHHEADLRSRIQELQMDHALEIKQIRERQQLQDQININKLKTLCAKYCSRIATLEKSLMDEREKRITTEKELADVCSRQCISSEKTFLDSRDRTLQSDLNGQEKQEEHEGAFYDKDSSAEADDTRNQELETAVARSRVERWRFEAALSSEMMQRLNDQIQHHQNITKRQDLILQKYKNKIECLQLENQQLKERGGGKKKKKRHQSNLQRSKGIWR